MAAFAADLPGIAVGATRAAFTGLPTNDVFVGLIQRGMCQEVILSPTLWDAFAQFDDEGCAPDPTPADLDPDAPETARDRYFAYVGSIAAYAFCWRYAERLVAGQDAPLLRDVPPPDAARVSAAAAAIETAQAGPGRSDQLAFAAVQGGGGGGEARAACRAASGGSGAGRVARHRAGGRRLRRRAAAARHLGRRPPPGRLPAPLPWADAAVSLHGLLRADRRPARRHRRAGRRPARRRALPDAARRHRHGQDGDDGVGDRADPAAGARDRPQQDAGRAALQRVPRVLRRQLRRVLRLVLRLLPARGLPGRVRHVHREGLGDQRRHRPAPALGDVVAADAARRDHRRLGVLHLRPRLAGRVRGAARPAPGRRRVRPREAAARPGRDPVQPQRRRARPRPVPRPRRRDRGAAGLLGDGLPRVAVRRRGGVDHALRPAHRRGAGAPRRPHALSGHALRDVAADARARDRGDRRRARGAGRVLRRRRARRSRRTGSASARSTTSR